MLIEPNIQDCFNLYESIRRETRQKIKKLEELKNMMSKPWGEEINKIIQSERDEDKFFGHERSKVADIYYAYRVLRVRKKMPIEIFESYFVSQHHTQQDYRFLRGCLPIFAAMFEREDKTKEVTGE